MEEIDWTEHTGTRGGWPVTVKTYWEGRRGDERVCWITPLSNGEWLLAAPRENGRVTHRSTDCGELKALAATTF